MNLQAEQEAMKARWAALKRGPLKPYKIQANGRSYWTYLMQATTTGRVKIGKSTNIMRRLRALQCSAAEPIVLIGAVVGDYEGMLHSALAPYWVHGEWFTSEVIPVVKNLVDRNWIDGSRFLSRKKPARLRQHR